MNTNDLNGNGNTPVNAVEVAEEHSAGFARTRSPFPQEPETIEGRANGQEAKGFATRADLNGKPGMERSKMILLGGGLLAAALFFVFTAVIGNSRSSSKAPKKQQSQDTQQSKTDEHKGSVTPLMETVRKPALDNAGG